MWIPRVSPFSNERDGKSRHRSNESFIIGCFIYKMIEKFEYSLYVGGRTMGTTF